MATKMILNGYTASIMEAERLTGEQIHMLPPGRPLEVIEVDRFIKKPDNWMTGPGSYVVPVKPNKGLWFDWTYNDALNTAVLPTVKGCNPITGRPVKGFGLEYLGDRCPEHGIELINGSCCKECGYELPPQNYVPGNSNTLWWDGFRSEDGKVRQFFFTEDPSRDIPSHLIGKDNTVPAFGFAFFSPIKKRTPAALDGRAYNYLASEALCLSSHEGPTFSTMINSSTYGTTENSRSLLANATELKDVSIGAGAKINQGLSADRYPNDWKSEPDAVMRIYFVFEDEYNKWKSHGLKPESLNEKGFLKGLPVG
jgi:hypothetical protein